MPEMMRMRDARSELARPLRFGDAKQIAALDALHACCEKAADGCWDEFVRCEACRKHLCDEHVWVQGWRYLCERCANAAYEDEGADAVS